ncbi:MAG: hydrogenase formation protein HypD [Lentisphaerales bacterium]|jgi:hydrogenase expression/formation protein HypD|nr:MAG: hydrogenase formation protein HypD [Lentisphaerales bacterium]
MNMETSVKNIQTLTHEIGRPVVFMEVCGTHTVSAFRTGLRSLLPDAVTLLSGPGCPVCVTPTGYLDTAIAITKKQRTIIATFGDMLRVPGTESSLEREKALGADIRMVYSPTDALKMAKETPNTSVVFLGVGFETTTPAVAWTIKEAMDKHIENYFVLCAHKTVPEAMMTLVSAGDVNLDGFLCPGHVSVITGSDVYGPVCAKAKIPCVVAGFEALDMARGIEMLAQQVAEHRAEVEVEYTRSVTPKGNAEAQRLCSEVFEKCDTQWRGFGVIPQSGLRISDTYASTDASIAFQNLTVPAPKDHSACRCGDVLRGACIPPGCPLFGKACTPSTPVGACMVSSEGACAAYHKYGAS